MLLKANKYRKDKKADCRQNELGSRIFVGRVFVDYAKCLHFYPSFSYGRIIAGERKAACTLHKLAGKRRAELSLVLQGHARHSCPSKPYVSPSSKGGAPRTCISALKVGGRQKNNRLARKGAETVRNAGEEQVVKD